MRTCSESSDTVGSTDLEKKRAYHRQWYLNGGKEKKQAYYRKHSAKRQRYIKEWVATHREQHNRNTAAYKLRLRLQVLSAYGGRCECCGDSTTEFLTVDHTNGGGNKHRRELGYKSLNQYLKDNGFPKDGFRILCYNCNMARGNVGYCPHEKKQLPVVEQLGLLR